MAKVGIQGFRYALQTADTVAALTYSEPVLVPGVVSVDIKTGKDTATLFADDGPYETASALGEITVDIELADLPLDVLWVDSRDGVFPQATPAHVRCEHSDPVQAAVADVLPGSRVVVMSFSHAEDFEIIAACLHRQRTRGDLPYIGLIGSSTKWASFQRRLRDRGFAPGELARVTCPIGVPGIGGKQPAVVAVAVEAQLLQCDAAGALEASKDQA